MKTRNNPFIGTWSIIEMEVWDQEFVNMDVPGHFTFEKDGLGFFQFGMVQGELDCRVETGDRGARIEFSWEGQDETDPGSGRGWAVIENEELCGRIFIHLGDDSAFRAQKARKGRSRE
jgi:hypothetical protein